MSVRVRTARPADAIDVRRILDAAMLEPGNVEGRIEAGDVLVATDRVSRAADSANSSDHGESTRERILGTLVLEPGAESAHIAAIGVRRRHRDRGIGRALVEHAAEREPTLTARFDADVRPFYEALSFHIEPIDDRRFRGYRDRSR
ncbi:GNAT family N-acetyltransferase [Halobacteria archaeon AArc-dxtr1]|nr:GNAT family N-acetyltransferase [Halobacteria archaeon AArc-dxtr1]